MELPIDFESSTFDVLDLEPEIDGVDWIEEDPQLPDGTANLYVYRLSTCSVSLHLDDEFEVWVPSLSSSANWEIAFQVLRLAAELFETVFVTWNDGDLWELDELFELFGDVRQKAEFDSDVRELERRVAVEGAIAVKGALRSTHIGPGVLKEVASGACSIEEVLLRTNYVAGPHLAAAVVEEQVDGKLRAVTVLGPGLRTLLPPADAVLIETIDTTKPPILLPVAAFDTVAGLDVVLLDEGHRLVQAVPESAWPAVLESAFAQLEQ